MRTLFPVAISPIILVSPQGKRATTRAKHPDILAVNGGCPLVGPIRPHGFRSRTDHKIPGSPDFPKVVKLFPSFLLAWDGSLDISKTATYPSRIMRGGQAIISPSGSAPDCSVYHSDLEYRHNLVARPAVLEQGMST